MALVVLIPCHLEYSQPVLIFTCLLEGWFFVLYVCVVEFLPKRLVLCPGWGEPYITHVGLGGSVSAAVHI